MEAPAEVRSTGSFSLSRAMRSSVLLLFSAVLVLAIIDSVRSWQTKHVLANAARQAAKVSVSAPLNVKNCRQATPCPVAWAAAAAKQSLLEAGVKQAACINPSQPTFSGVLIWVFSCDGSIACNKSDTVCVKIDMTPVARASNGDFL